MEKVLGVCYEIKSTLLQMLAERVMNTNVFSDVIHNERGSDKMQSREGRILQERRKELGLTQEEVALELKMSIHQYQRYEYGEHKLANARMRVGLRICEVLELNPYEVVF